MNVALKNQGLDAAVALFKAEASKSCSGPDEPHSQHGETRSKRVTRSMSQSVLSSPSFKSQGLASARIPNV